MKPFIKTTLLCLLCVTIIFSTAAPVSAADEPETTTSVSYDLSVGGTQVFRLTDENGEESIITITELKSSARVANGVYQIKHTKTGFWSAGYKISVSNNRITSAYEKYATPVFGSITDDVLSMDSSKQVSYQFNYHIMFSTLPTGIRCVLDGETLNISVI